MGFVNKSFVNKSLMKAVSKSPFSRIVLAQSITTVFVTVCLLMIDPVDAYSAFLGGFVCVLASVYTLAQSIGSERFLDPGLTATIKAEAGKYAIIIAMCVVIFTQVKPLSVLAFFATFAGFQFFYLLVPLLDAQRLRRR